MVCFPSRSYGFESLCSQKNLQFLNRLFSIVLDRTYSYKNVRYTVKVQILEYVKEFSLTSASGVYKQKKRISSAGNFHYYYSFSFINQCFTYNVLRCMGFVPHTGVYLFSDYNRVFRQKFGIESEFSLQTLQPQLLRYSLPKFNNYLNHKYLSR